MSIIYRGSPASKTLLGGLGLALSGTLLHDLMEFGYPSPQNTIPMTILFGLLFWGWVRRPAWRSPIVYALAAISLVMLFGAVTSVLPLAFWPWEPEQSVDHYAVHLIWTASLVILLVILVRRRPLLAE